MRSARRTPLPRLWTRATSILAVVTFVTLPALAEPPAAGGGDARPTAIDPRDNRAAAQVLFERARDLVERNHFAEACPQFAESQRLDPGIGTLLWLADCYENTGQTASAWTAYSQAAADAATRHDPREAVARQRAANLERALPRLTIVVSPEAAATSELEIHCDGVPVSHATWGRPIPLDPGSHMVTANGANGRLWWTTVQLALGRADASVVVPALIDASLPAPTPAQAMAVPEMVPLPSGGDAPRDAGRAQRVTSLAIAAGGLTSLVVGSYFSLRAKAKYDDSNAGPCRPDNECTAAGIADRDSANSLATIATVAIGGGAALLLTAAAVYLAAPHDPPRRATLSRSGVPRVALAPGARGGSVRVSWHW